MFTSFKVDFQISYLRLEDSEDLVAGDASDLSDAVRVTQNHTDLRGAETLKFLNFMYSCKNAFLIIV